MKRPSFQFYPGDWLRATDLRSCSVGARGLWIDMLCLMHEGTPYGHLRVAEKVILPANLARIVGATLEETEGWLAELRDAGVCSIGEDGCIFSRRMIRDEQVRQSRASGGKLGGNPVLKDKAKVAKEVNLPPNLRPTPSSSSASSSAKTEAKASSTPGPLPDWLDADTWGAFREMRRGIKAPMTPKAEALMVTKLDDFRRAGHDPTFVLEQSIRNSWKDVYKPKEDHDENNRRPGGANARPNRGGNGAPAYDNRDPASRARDIGEDIIARRRAQRLAQGTDQGQPRSPGQSDPAALPGLRLPEGIRGQSPDDGVP